MKTVILIIVLLGPVPLHAQESSPCLVPDSVVELYRDGADRLALRLTLDDSTSWTDSARINPALSDSILTALWAVYDAKHLPIRDTVVDMLNIQVGWEINLTDFQISADTSYTWVKELEKDSVVSGVVVVDSLLALYQLGLKSAWQSSGGGLIMTFSAPRNYNFLAIAKDFDSLPGVFFAYAIPYGGDGNDIFASFHSNYIELTYSHGWGDCYMGCIYRHYWKFRVYDNCSVQYMGSYGDPLPADLTLQEEQETPVVEVSPNPFTNQINVSGAADNAEFVLYNSTGQKMQEGRLSDRRIQIDNSLSSGVYILVLKTRSGGEKVFRVVKQ